MHPYTATLHWKKKVRNHVKTVWLGAQAETWLMHGHHKPALTTVPVWQCGQPDISARTSGWWQRTDIHMTALPKICVQTVCLVRRSVSHLRKYWNRIIYSCAFYFWLQRRHNQFLPRQIYSWWNETVFGIRREGLLSLIQTYTPKCSLLPSWIFSRAIDGPPTASSYTAMTGSMTKPRKMMHICSVSVHTTAFIPPSEV